MLTGLNDVEQLPNQSQGIHLFVILAGRKAEKLGPERGNPQGTYRQGKTLQGHSAANGLCSDRLVSPGGEGLSPEVSLPLSLPTIEERSHTRFDLALLFSPHGWLPKGHQVAKSVNPDILMKPACARGPA